MTPGVDQNYSAQDPCECHQTCIGQTVVHVGQGKGNKKPCQLKIRDWKDPGYYYWHCYFFILVTSRDGLP